MDIRGADVGHSLRVTDDGNRCGETLETHITVHLGQGSMRLEVEPSDHAQKEHHERCQHHTNEPHHPD